ncbi:beta-galactosidase [Eisenbergiella tayi]|uniref:beta-galactosidase n=1 Tax=Eisenbergiella tayi TaxID=1432052 RepID=UPI0004B7F858|nr:beta-galactosidase [Eisenbergiella tayi]
MKNTELFSYTSEYLTRNGRPWFPVMGEFHYSRYPDSYWEESLYKMKVCGVDVVSAYVIWIHHEEEEGKYLFSGCRDLHKFLDAAKKMRIAGFSENRPMVPWRSS